MKFLSLIFTIAVLRVACYVQTDDQKSITMLKTYYIEHEKVWREFYPKSPDVFYEKLYALQSKYCTKKLQNLSKKLLDEPGTDVLTYDRGIDTNALKMMTIVKDPVKKNIYLINYDTLIRVGGAKFKKIHVTLNVVVIKVGEDYKIASVNGYPK
jgi:hypothetical protein